MKNDHQWIRGLCLLAILLITGCKPRQARQAAPATSATDTVRVEIPSYPLENEKDLDVLMEEIGDARIVLLGEASHGTSEYYTWRAAISRRLIQEKGFDFIAVEGEWADSYRVNQFVRGEKKDSAAVLALLKHFNRWPTWMWGNYEVASLVSWMNTYNQGKDTADRIGFYGLDVYCLWESVNELAPYIKGADADLQRAAQRVDRCFRPFSADAYQYASAVAKASADCRNETTRLWERIGQLTGEATARNEAHFVMQQNALVALNGERYYRTMVSDDDESWNIRDRHMTQTLSRLMERHGAEAKGIVWEHNTHVGDARYTDMARSGQTNVGELARKQWGEDNVFIVGFGSHRGTVIASRRWGGAIERMEVPPAQPDSWEDLLHRISPQNRIILSRDLRPQAALNNWMGHRAIGVVYQPQVEHLGNYVPSVLPKRYDAFLYFDQTRALHPLQIPVNVKEPPDTYPWGY